MNKKLALDALKNLAFGAYKMIINSDFKKFEMATPDKAEFFYFNMEHNFPKGKGGDDEDEKGGSGSTIAIFGKPDQLMKKEIKERTKKHKKETLAGKGYITTDEKGNKIFNAFVIAGDAKPEKFLKGASKKLFSFLGITAFNILGQLGEEALDAVEAEVLDDNQEETPKDTNNAAEQEKGLRTLLDQFKAMLPAVQPLLKLILGGKGAGQGSSSILDGIKKNIEIFKANLDKVLEEVKVKFAPVIPQMDKILDIISGEGTREQANEVTDSFKAAEELKKLIEKAQKFLAGVNLDAMAS